MRRTVFALLVASLLPDCAAAVAAPPVCPDKPRDAAKPESAPTKEAPLPAADLTVLLRPLFESEPRVHVELDLRRNDRPRLVFNIARATSDGVANVSAKDDTGDLPVEAAAAGDGLKLTLQRPPKGAVHLAYDVLAKGDNPRDPLGLIVEDGRFRGSGERLLALASEYSEVYLKVEVRIDGAAIRAPGSASSLGVGANRRTTLPLGDLRYAAFLSGALGAAVIDDPSAGHDEAAWVGFTGFDPRPAVAELAVMRTALHELFHFRVLNPWTHLFFSERRATGDFAITSRASSALLQLGPGEPWSAGLRLALCQNLARRFVGGEISFATEAGHEAEAFWFHEGVSRWAAVRTLSRAAIFSPDDVRDAVVSAIAVLATSPYRSTNNADLSAIASGKGPSRDPHEIALARATLAARGTLYATRASSRIPQGAHGEGGLAGTLSDFIDNDDAPGQTRGAIEASKWKAALAKVDPAAPAAYDAFIVRGEPFELPSTALGPCFQAGTREYVEFDPGFDVEASRSDPDKKVHGVRAGGPAARAGLKEGDTALEISLPAGDARLAAKLSVMRDGKKIDVTYAPRGRHGRGQTFTRIRSIEDERCGLAP